MDLLYELWMHDVCGFDPKKVDKCMFVFKNAYNAFHSKPYSVDRIKAFGMYGFVSAPKNLERAESIMDDCREKGIRILSIEDEEYPELLRQIYLPPRLLFVTGTLKNFNGCFPVSVVGTRRATEQGKYFTQRLTEKLCRKNNILIVSGMAEGIDAAAHRGALKAGAKTVAVLAGGCDIIYPLSNRKLYYEILENGAVISEKPPGTPGKGYFYHQRNRIIAGFSKCSIVVEGRARSGAKITARHAIENNRDLFTVPGSPMSPQAELPNMLIKDGAGIVTNENDIIDEYSEVYPEYFDCRIDNETKEHAFEGGILTKEEKLITEYMKECGGSASAEKMCEVLRLETGELNAALTMMCIKDYIVQLSQDCYMLKEAEKNAG